MHGFWSGKQLLIYHQERRYWPSNAVLARYPDSGPAAGEACPLNEPVPNDHFRRGRSDGPFVFCFSALGPGGSRGHG